MRSAIHTHKIMDIQYTDDLWLCVTNYFLEHSEGGSSPLTYSNRAVDERVSTDIASAIEILVQSEGRALR